MDWFVEFFTLAVNDCVWFLFKVVADGVSDTEMGRVTVTGVGASALALVLLEDPAPKNTPLMTAFGPLVLVTLILTCPETLQTR